jgi:hypothetical protein
VKRTTLGFWIAAGVALAATSIDGWQAGTGARPLNGRKLEITALAVNMSNIGTGGSANVEFTIDRWSTPDVRRKLIETMTTSGPDALLKALREQPPVGRMRFPNLNGPDPTNVRLGWDVRYASERELPEGGRRIVLALDRTMSFWEVSRRPRTVDYPFTFIQIQVNAEGEGEGKLSLATKVNFDKEKNEIELETYASEPLRLQSVRVKERT